MIRFFRPLLLLLACGVACLAGGCMTNQATPAPPLPAPIQRAPMVGGLCTYTDYPSKFFVTSIAADGKNWKVGFSMSLDRADVAQELVGHVAGVGPAVGRTFPGVARHETHGTCTPWVYVVMVDGVPVTLEPIW